MNLFLIFSTLSCLVCPRKTGFIFSKWRIQRKCMMPLVLDRCSLSSHEKAVYMLQRLEILFNLANTLSWLWRAQTVYIMWSLMNYCTKKKRKFESDCFGKHRKIPISGQSFYLKVWKTGFRIFICEARKLLALTSPI